MTTNRDFAAANAKSLARLAMEPHTVRGVLRQMVEMMDKGDEPGAGSHWHLEATLALANEPDPDTDWHAEALMYSNALGKVKDWCDMQHPKRPFYYGNEVSSIECGCAECETKRRILAIIARNLK